MFKKIKKILYRSLENTEISYKKLQEMRQNNPNTILVDVRSRQEFEEGHLDQAISIPLYSLEEKLDMISDKNNPIIIYCASRL